LLNWGKLNALLGKALVGVVGNIFINTINQAEPSTPSTPATEQNHQHRRQIK